MSWEMSGGNLPTEEAEDVGERSKVPRGRGKGGVLAHTEVWGTARKAGKNMCRRKKSCRHCLDSAVPWGMAVWRLLEREAWAIQRPDQAKPSRQRDLRHVAQICSGMHQSFSSARHCAEWKNGVRAGTRPRRKVPGVYLGRLLAMCAEHGPHEAVSIALYMTITTPTAQWTHLEPYLEIRQGAGPWPPR